MEKKLIKLELTKSAVELLLHSINEDQELFRQDIDNEISRMQFQELQTLKNYLESQI